jgi:DNA polymerase-3 subunit alpha
MDEKICNFSLKEANDARKIVGKKQMAKIPELKEKILTQAKSPNLGQYVWKYGVGPQMGYSFSVIHALAYSFIGYQTAYLATKWNPIYWNTACLIVNSGSLEEDDETDVLDRYYICAEKKDSSTDYAKLAKALGEIIQQKIKVSLIDINRSDYGFKPDVANNQILFGLKALSGVGAPIIEQIILNRPYKSLKDFMHKCSLNKTAMISLIKSGAFDNLEKEWSESLNREPRVIAMADYLSRVFDKKERLTLQNFNGLVQYNFIPAEYEFEKKTYTFNKILKKCKFKDYYFFNPEMECFYRDNFDEDHLEVIEGHTCILQKEWDKIYKQIMKTISDWLKKNQKELLSKYNFILFKEAWDKYASGTISA